MLVEPPHLPQLRPASEHSPQPTRCTILNSGLRVASQEMFGLASQIGVYVDCGTRHENAPGERGCTHLLNHVWFRETERRTEEELAAAFDAIGAHPENMFQRDGTSVSMDVMRDKIPEAVELLADCVQRPRITAENVQHAKEMVGIWYEDMQIAPAETHVAQVVIEEAVHETAFGADSPLGHPSNCSLEQLPRLDEANVRAFFERNFTPDRIVLAAAGAEHDELVRLADEHFGGGGILREVDAAAPVVGGAGADPPAYVGGEARRSDANVEGAEFTHMALMFKGPSWHAEEDLVPMCVLQHLLGGGDAFSAGGPGKGMHSRLYREVLNRHYWVERIVATGFHYSDIGVFGLLGACRADRTGEFLRVLVQHFERAVADPGNEDELARARNQLKSNLLMQLEFRAFLCEDIGRQVLEYGRRQMTQELCEQIDAVTAEDVRRTMEQIVASEPTLITYGNMRTLPENAFDMVRRAFGSGQASKEGAHGVFGSVDKKQPSRWEQIFKNNAR